MHQDAFSKLWSISSSPYSNQVNKIVPFAGFHQESVYLETQEPNQHFFQHSMGVVGLLKFLLGTGGWDLRGRTCASVAMCAPAVRLFVGMQ